MRATVALARKHGVAIGAHPGFADRANFGRKELNLPATEIAASILNQIRILQQVAIENGATVQHVKLHGALYNLAARDAVMAKAVVNAIGMTGKNPVLFVLAGSELERVARANQDFAVVSEVFADRTYQPDGSLTPRSQPDALIHDEDAAVAQVLRMITAGVVRATDGTDVPIVADTVCLHGDGPHAVAFARRLRAELGAAGVEVKRFAAEP
jgi:UPF0271 protein